MGRLTPALAVVAWSAPVVGQDSAETGDSVGAAYSLGAVLGMAAVLLIAWITTRWVASPFLRHATQPASPVPDTTETIQRLGPIELDTLAHRVLLSGDEVELTAKEYDLLRFLMHHQGEACERADLLREVWGHRDLVHTRTVDTHVQRLRDKLGPARDLLETVRGVGYRLRA